MRSGATGRSAAGPCGPALVPAVRPVGRRGRHDCVGIDRRAACRAPPPSRRPPAAQAPDVVGHHTQQALLHLAARPSISSVSAWAMADSGLVDLVCDAGRDAAPSPPALLLPYAPVRCARPSSSSTQNSVAGCPLQRWRREEAHAHAQRACRQGRKLSTTSLPASASTIWPARCNCLAQRGPFRTALQLEAAPPAWPRVDSSCAPVLWRAHAQLAVDDQHLSAILLDHQPVQLRPRWRPVPCRRGRRFPRQAVTNSPASSDGEEADAGQARLRDQHAAGGIGTGRVPGREQYQRLPPRWWPATSAARSARRTSAPAAPAARAKFRLPLTSAGAARRSPPGPRRWSPATAEWLRRAVPAVAASARRSVAAATAYRIARHSQGTAARASASGSSPSGWRQLHAHDQRHADGRPCCGVGAVDALPAQNRARFEDAPQSGATASRRSVPVGHRLCPCRAPNRRGSAPVGASACRRPRRARRTRIRRRAESRPAGCACARPVALACGRRCPRAALRSFIPVLADRLRPAP